MSVLQAVKNPTHAETESFDWDEIVKDIEEAVTSYTRAIIVNSPNNPSGAIYPPELIEKLVNFCEGRGIFMVCDDIYHKLVFDRNEAVPAYRYTKKGNIIEFIEYRRH